MADRPITPFTLLSMSLRAMASSPAWIGKAIVLGILLCIPIVNFIALGYALQWGRRGAFGPNRPMTWSLLGDQAFLMGFFVFIVNLIWTFIQTLFLNIPIVGFLIMFCLSPFVYLCIIRMGVHGRFSDAFAFGDAWPRFIGHFAELLLIVWLPMIVAELVGQLSSWYTMGALGLTNEMLVAIATGAVDAQAFVANLQIAPTTGLAMMLLALLYSVVTAVAQLVMYRALGYWVARYAPEWVHDAYMMGTQPMDGWPTGPMGPTGPTGPSGPTGAGPMNGGSRYV